MTPNHRHRRPCPQKWCAGRDIERLDHRSEHAATARADAPTEHEAMKTLSNAERGVLPLGPMPVKFHEIVGPPDVVKSRA
jgi:hypothetical protein